MKKTRKTTLVLQRETLRVLSPKQIWMVGGAQDRIAALIEPITELATTCATTG